MMRRRYRKCNLMYYINLTPKTFKQQLVNLYLSHCVCWSVKNLNIAITSISWLRLQFLSNVIPQTLNEVVAETVPLKTYLSEQFQQKMKKVKVVILTIPATYCIPRLVPYSEKSYSYW